MKIDIVGQMTFNRNRYHLKKVQQSLLLVFARLAVADTPGLLTFLNSTNATQVWAPVSGGIPILNIIFSAVITTMVGKADRRLWSL